jgi:tRNA dimethylallyltransferase
METGKKNNIIVICGPTASGKTRLAVSVAGHVNGEIVSADSRQVYRGMDIGTGKDLIEYNTTSGTVPYHLIDIADPSEIYTLYHFQRDCFQVIKNIWSRKKLPVMAGGTGLYIEAVLKQYKVPNVPENPDLRISLMNKRKGELLNQLKSLNRELCNSTDLNSKKRIVRSIEVALYAKNHNIQWGIANPPDISPLIIGVKWPRTLLCERIDKRLKERLENGMVKEVERLLDSGIPLKRLELFGMEYKHIARYLHKKVTCDNMVTELRHDIHQLAKRQMTYFRGFERRGLQVYWVDKANVEKTTDIIKKFKFKYIKIDKK